MVGYLIIKEFNYVFWLFIELYEGFLLFSFSVINFLYFLEV